MFEQNSNRHRSFLVNGIVISLQISERRAAEVAKLHDSDGDARMEMVTKKMAILGVFGLLDPPKASVKASVKVCQNAGMRVVMITGDQPATATAIARDLGILSERRGEQARMCLDLHDGEEMQSEQEIDRLVTKTSAWARAQPADKVTIVESLQRMGPTKGMRND